MECSTICDSIHGDEEEEELCVEDGHNNGGGHRPDYGDDDNNKEAEGVWSSDIEKSFTEALSLYPPCGRRKIVLSEEGKMYGRNELIARYIKMQTGKTRSRKQVSSHIQVLARRKSKDIQNHIQEKHSREHARQQLANMSSAQIVSDFKLSENLSLSNDNGKSSKFIDHSVNSFTNSQVLSRFTSIPHPSSLVSNSKSFDNSSFLLRQTSATQMLPCNNTSKLYVPLESPTEHLSNSHSQFANMWGLPRLSRPSSQSDLSLNAAPHLKVGRSIATSKMRLIELSAFLEADDSLMKQDKQYPMKNYWKHIFANLNAKDINLFPPFLENIEISQIWDKYPESDGLKDFFEKGPQDAFFMVKFWIDINIEVYPQCNQAWTIIFEGVDNVKIKLSTKLCSFGRQVLERIEERSPTFENGAFMYRFENESMCDYMRKFIVKLSSLEERSMMNSVLENFTILQTVVNAFTGEILLCIAFAMEVSVTDQGSQYHIYKLIRHSNMVPPINTV